MDFAHKGEAALSAGNLEEAISLYSQAIQQSPGAATYYIKRSTAYQRSSKFAEALEDAEQAVLSATTRAKRELIAQAQLRRAIALYQLGRYGDAGFVLEVTKRLNPSEKSVGMWEAKNNSKLKSLAEDDEAGKVTVKELPDAPPAKESQATKSTSTPKEVTPATSTTTTKGPGTESVASTTSKDKIRHEWYQSPENVHLTLYAKGVPKDHPSTAIDIQPRSVSISFPLSSGSQYDFSLDPLFSDISVNQSTYKILSTKVEVTMRKSVANVKWPQLESDSNAASSDGTTSTTPHNTITAPSTTAPGPSYPTSSKTGPKNWDAIVKDYTRKTPKDGTDESAKDMMTEEDDLEDGDEVSAFFKKLYANADPDTRRAMMKSYQESGGTALSTNWGEVGKERVPVSPPDGMEEKKW